MKSETADSASKHIFKKHPSLASLIQKSEIHVLKWSIVLVGISLLAFGFGMYLRHFKPTPDYFEVLHTAQDKTALNKMVPLSHPNFNTQTLLKWAVEAATAAYRLNFYDYADAIKKMRPYFTESGYQNFVSDFSNRVLPVLKQKKLVLTSVVTDTPIVLKEGKIINNLYAWEIQFPMLLTYESQSDKIYQRVVVTLFIVQVPTTESPQGVGIVSFITRESPQT